MKSFKILLAASVLALSTSAAFAQGVGAGSDQSGVGARGPTHRRFVCVPGRAVPFRTPPTIGDGSRLSASRAAV